MNNFKQLRLAGIVAIIILGFLLHYSYSWTSSLKIIGVFVPVNESVWEHLKLGYWSLVLFSIFEYLSIKGNANNYYVAKIIGILSLETTILIIFYSCTFITGKHILLIDILSYVLGVILCQYLTYAFFRFEPFPMFINRISLTLFISLGLLFGITTYYPPHIELFKDFNSGTYGISREE